MPQGRAGRDTQMLKLRVTSDIRIASLVMLLVLTISHCSDLGDSPSGGNGRDPEQTLPTDSQAAWSPDGNWITYLHEDYDMTDSTYPTGLYLIDASGASRRLLVEGSARNPAWSPDGQWIAFQSGAIYAVSFLGDSIRRITPFGGFFPSWSPDGTQLVFDTPYQDPRGANAIWIINADGTNPRDISVHGTGEWRDPDWSPDGARILHMRFLGGVFGEEIFVMDTSGNNPIRLTQDNTQERTPKWSADGAKISWTKLLPGAKFECWIMDANGGNKRLLLKDGFSAAWSNTSQQLVLSKPDNEYTKIILWTIRADGSNLRQLTY